jgi:bis(5'-nucleosyl)-tetraphosphatase (symmetrical)
MATYAIGDVQGCCKSLERLLDKLDLRSSDRLWFVGDLVNRGPYNVEVLRLIRSFGKRAVVVLGNHDLHLLMRAAGLSKEKKRDTLDDVLHARDRDELIDWLKTRSLAHREKRWLLVHAGLLPRWSAETAVGWAERVERSLRAGHLEDLRDERSRESEAARVLTRIRLVRTDGEPSEDFAGPPDEAPRGFLPWFDHPRRKSRDVTVVFGHWSALGLHVTQDAIGLDTGCVWGRSLTAIRLEDGEIYKQKSLEAK